MSADATDPSPDVRGFLEWVYGRRSAADGTIEQSEFQNYYSGIADARYIIRRVFRIVDEAARDHGLEALEHLALIQVHGHSADAPHIGLIASRLDISAALASRLMKRLERLALVQRAPSPGDRRATIMTTTSRGRELLAEVDADVKIRVRRFQHSISDDERLAALAIFGFYLGLAPAYDQLSTLIDDSRDA